MQAERAGRGESAWETGLETPRDSSCVASSARTDDNYFAAGRLARKTTGVGFEPIRQERRIVPLAPTQIGPQKTQQEIPGKGGALSAM